jgi:hypothetical protein
MPKLLLHLGKLRYTSVSSAHRLPEAQMRAINACLIVAAANPEEVAPADVAIALELEMV